MALRCERALLPLICAEPVVERCAYCGKHFCMKHGYLDKACCKSYTCMALYKKDRAISERKRWEEERFLIGQERNKMGLCAQPECPSEVYVDCGHCENLYCSRHVQRHDFTFYTHTRRGSTRIRGDILLCEVCQPYLREYKKDRYE
jgi:hypothetical protein